jgi:hypothetical protein
MGVPTVGADTSSADLLRGPRLKIERAKYHIDDLSEQIDAYLARGPFALMARDDPEATKLVYIVKNTEPIPDSFALLLGDAVHNLRVALDYSIFGMVGAKARRPQAIQFPFSRNAEGLEDEIKRREIEVAGTNVVDAIKALRPYPGGDEYLSGLHDLDITDKHRLILAVGRAAEFSAEQLNELGRHSGVRFLGPGVIRATGQKPLEISLPFTNRANTGHQEVTERKAEIQPVFQICFGDGQVFANQLVIEKLHAIAGRIGEVVELLVAEHLRLPA